MPIEVVTFCAIMLMIFAIGIVVLVVIGFIWGINWVIKKIFGVDCLDFFNKFWDNLWREIKNILEGKD
jgi:predicted neutral ceramidase superfamily lipid hydrolase